MADCNCTHYEGKGPCIHAPVKEVRAWEQGKLDAKQKPSTRMATSSLYRMLKIQATDDWDEILEAYDAGFDTTLKR